MPCVARSKNSNLFVIFADLCLLIFLFSKTKTKEKKKKMKIKEQPFEIFRNMMFQD